MILAVTSQTYWYLTRGTGLVSIVLLTVSMVLGVAQVERWLESSRQRFVVTQMHRNTSLLVVVFLALHILTAVLDTFAPVHWIDTLVPFVSSYRPIWLGLGAVAFDLLIALVVTSLLRQRIGHTTWRAVHWAAYLCWPIAFVHGLGTGSDGRVGWVQVLDVVCLVAVLGALVWRLADDWERAHRVRLGAAITATVSVFALVAWARTGPTQPGWARKAGTPTELLAGAGTANGTATAFDEPFAVPVTGTITSTAGSGDTETVTITGTMSDGPTGTVTVAIQGVAASGGGVRMQSSTASIGPADQPDLFVGAITRLSGESLTLALTGPDGSSATVQLDLDVDRAGATFTGTITSTGT